MRRWHRERVWTWRKHCSVFYGGVNVIKKGSDCVEVLYWSCPYHEDVVYVTPPYEGVYMGLLMTIYRSALGSSLRLTETLLWPQTDSFPFHFFFNPKFSIVWGWEGEGCHFFTGKVPTLLNSILAIRLSGYLSKYLQRCNFKSEHSYRGTLIARSLAHCGARKQFQIIFAWL